MMKWRPQQDNYDVLHNKYGDGLKLISLQILLETLNIIIFTFVTLRAIDLDHTKWKNYNYISV